jgi:acyl carrier protein
VVVWAEIPLDRCFAHRASWGWRARRSVSTGMFRETDLNYKAPQTEAELTIAGILQQVLQIERVGVDDNFFDLGGNSLLLAQVHEQLQDRFGREIVLVEIFNHPTVRALATHLEGTPVAGAAERAGDRTEQLRQGRDRLRRRLQQKR